MSTQDSLIPKTEEQLEKEYIKFLERRGYNVVKLTTCDKAPNTGDIVSHFYNRLESSSGPTTAAVSSLSDSKDFKAVSKFQEKAKKVGYGRSMANRVLFDLIDMVFDMYEDLDDTCPLYSLDYLISQRGSWLLQKALQYTRRKNDNYECSAEAEAYKREVYNNLDSDEFKAIQALKHADILQKIKEDGLDGTEEE